MASNATIGALRVVLGLDSAQFTEGLSAAQKELNKAGRSLQSIGGNLEKVGARLTLGITAPVAAIGVTAIKAATESRQAFGQVEAALASMGGASGKTAAELQKSAGALQSMSTFDDDDILRKVTANLLTFGNVSGEAFDRAQLAAVNLSARLGQDLQSSAIQVGKALNDPVKGVTALQRVGVSFTEAQKAQIEAMVAGGDAAGAQAVILGELEKQFGGAAAALREATPTADLQESWRSFTEVIGEIALKVLPPLTQALTGALEWFNKLPEPVQTGVVAFGAFAAAIGPIVGVVGAITTAIGAALPVIGAVGPALVIVGRAAMALLGPTNPLGLLLLAIAGIVTVWMNWDKIWPVVKKLYTEVKTWIGDKLTAVFKAVEEKVKAVGDAFHELWDRVVGHSYVPDLVDGIDEHFGRLDGVMVDPAIAANDNVAEAFANTAQQVIGSVEGIFSAIKRKDWVGALGGLAQVAGQLGGGVGQFFRGVAGSLDGGMSGAGLALGDAIGGSIGGALTKGITASLAAGGLASVMGSAAGSMILAGGAGALGTAGMGLATLSATLGAAAPIIGVVVGLVALAKAFQKPSNQGAGYDLITGQISGQSRTKETEGAVIQTGDAILAIQRGLESTGIVLGDTVRGLVMGSRDDTQIYTTGGKTIYAAKGDPAAAAEAAFRAMLDGATYVSDAQRKLVESMVEAGAGFDAVAVALQGYAAAQALPQQLADAILALTDPQAYDTSQLKAAQDARRKSIEDAVEAGYLTAEQLAGVNAQLATLERLELDQVLARYAQAVDAATTAADHAVDAATRTLEAAYSQESSALERVADRFRGLADSLADFGKSLLATSGLMSAGARYAAARADFRATAARAASGDADAQAALPAAIAAFLDAGKAVAPNAAAVRRDQAEALAAVKAAEVSARAQASSAEQQLAQLRASVEGLLKLDANVTTVRVAIDALGVAIQEAAAAQAAATSQAVSAIAAQAANTNVQAQMLIESQAAQIAALRDEVGAGLAVVAANTRQAAQTLGDWDGDGMPDIRDIA